MLKLGDYSPSNFSLHYWVGLGKPDIFYGEPGVFRNPQFLQVLGNSLKDVYKRQVLQVFRRPGDYPDRQGPRAGPQSGRSAVLR